MRSTASERAIHVVPAKALVTMRVPSIHDAGSPCRFILVVMECMNRRQPRIGQLAAPRLPRSRLRHRFRELTLVQVSVETLRRHQRFVIALLDDPPSLHDDDGVRIADGG